MSSQRVLGLMALHVEASHRYDPNGLMLCDNEPDGAEAPRFYMLRTLAGNTWRFGHTLPQAIQQRLTTLCATEPITTDLWSPPGHYDAIRAVLAEDTPLTDGLSPRSPFPPAQLTDILYVNSLKRAFSLIRQIKFDGVVHFATC